MRNPFKVSPKLRTCIERWFDEWVPRPRCAGLADELFRTVEPRWLQIAICLRTSVRLVIPRSNQFPIKTEDPFHSMQSIGAVPIYISVAIGRHTQLCKALQQGASPLKTDEKFQKVQQNFSSQIQSSETKETETDDALRSLHDISNAVNY
ncbi:hypothetical protein Bbelb_023570 [Branchiostoma belcheri]|nr:hypothetical protein Bbelb_023570 [Branchiostoma belcheri]